MHAAVPPSLLARGATSWVTKLGRVHPCQIDGKNSKNPSSTVFLKGQAHARK